MEYIFMYVMIGFDNKNAIGFSTEFNNRVACEKVLADIEQETSTNYGAKYFKYRDLRCVPKGKKHGNTR